MKQELLESFSLEISQTRYQVKKIYPFFPVRFYFSYRIMALPYVMITPRSEHSKRLLRRVKAKLSPSETQGGTRTERQQKIP